MRQRRVDAKLKNVKGRIQEAVGIVTGSRTLEREGARLRAEGASHERTLEMRRKLGDFFERAAKRIKA
jgi:uncharacterized protein YjbJ (UPF0337 family)